MNNTNFNVLNFDDQCSVTSEFHRKKFASDLSSIVSDYLDQTANQVHRIHALKAEMRNKEMLDLELSIITRNGEEEATAISRSVLVKLDNALDAEECIDSHDRLKVECDRLTARILQAEQVKKFAHHQIEQATHPKYPALSPKKFWMMTMSASFLILGINFLFARFVGLKQTEILLIVLCEAVSILALALTPKETNPISSQSTIKSNQPDYALDPLPVS